MADPMHQILNTYPPGFFRSLEERTNAAFVKAHHLTCEHYAEPEQVNMLGQARHACCEEGFRAAAQDAGLAATVVHTRPPGGRYSLVSYEGIHLIRCNVQAHCGTPRPTRFRNAWAALNAWLDPLQLDLLRAVPRQSYGQLCGMIVVTAHKRYGDPSLPAFIGLGVPRSDLSNWIILEPMHRMLGLYHDQETKRHTPPEAPVEVKDRAVPRLKRFPGRKLGGLGLAEGLKERGMRSGTPGFRGERLAQARDSRGLTQVALGRLIGRNSSSISRWEAGAQSPEPDALRALARALEVPVAFFLRPVQDGGSAPMFFRSMASTTQSLRKRTQARLRWAQEIALSLQEWVDLPEVNVPVMDAVTDYREISHAAIETMANRCRAVWELGAGPIADVLLVLENAGIVVTKDDVGSVKMDGLSNWTAADSRPYVLIARDKDTCVRSRMDAAHELGHLVLHRGLEPKVLNNKADFKEIERQAFDFAGAFLMPAESFPAEVWTPSLNAFLALKERWKASIAAMIKRCATLHMLSEEYERRLWKHYSSRGWRKSEPLDDQLAVENPRLLSRSVRLLVGEKVRDRRALLSDFRLHGPDVEVLCGLAPGYMTEGSADVISLPKLKRAGRSVEGGGSVVPFRPANGEE